MDRPVKYKIRRQKDGSYVILELNGNRLTIHSHHDTYEEAHDEWVDLHEQPSQAETIKFLTDLRNADTKTQ